MTGNLTPERIVRCYEIAREALLEERCESGHWEGRLSASALATATAVMALERVRRTQSDEFRDASASTTHHSSRRLANENLLDRGEPEGVSPRTNTVVRGLTPSGSPGKSFEADHPNATCGWSADPAARAPSGTDFDPLIRGGLAWLASHQNPDGGWGDTTRSVSNISTTMLVHAVFHATATTEEFASVVGPAKQYIDRAGGVGAVLARYGKDRTFSIPILTHCALAGLVSWSDVLELPFELACLPPKFYKAVRLPVVSYALPALIAIGQARFHHRRPRNPLTWCLRSLSRNRTLRVLERIQPTNGGFLEAAPLTSFVTMSLASIGLENHPVARRGVQFIRESVCADGSWPIDTNLATWVTTLSVNALQDDLPFACRDDIRDWLLNQQYREPHPYTSADPGGWAWTDLPGGVPDADDTPGAILALLNLRPHESDPDGVSQRECTSLTDGVRWLLDMQNRDGGWPTFCRGWGRLPFDRSASDITAHCLRALFAWSQHPAGKSAGAAVRRRVETAFDAGFRYLARAQRTDGSWLPLWFGNQYGRDDENPTYGTSRVLAAYRDTGLLESQTAQKGLQWLLNAQNPDGGLGGAAGVDSSVEETALAVDLLLSSDASLTAASRGLIWLMDRVENGSFREPAPIGFYFAKLWYFESFYPLIFTVAALRRACQVFGNVPTATAAATGAVRVGSTSLV